MSKKKTPSTSGQPIPAGTRIRCPHCGSRHALFEVAGNATRLPLLYYTCTGITWLGAVRDHFACGARPDAEETHA